MKSIKAVISYLLAFTMLASVVVQAGYPVVAAPADSDVVIEEIVSDAGDVESEPVLPPADSSEVAEDEPTSTAQPAETEQPVETPAVEEPSVPVQEDDVQQPEEEPAMDEEEQPAEEEQPQPAESVFTAGVTVDVHAALAMAQDVQFTMTLTNAQGQEVGRTSGVLPANADGAAANVSLQQTGLESGSYLLAVSAPGFATYTQQLELQKDMYSTVTLYTGPLSGYDANKQAHPGFLRIGDANGDGVLDSKDADVIVDAIENGAAGLADLNRDGVADLIDLEYLAGNLNADETQVADVHSTVQTRVADNLAKPETNESTSVTGDLGDLVQDGGSVALAPANGGPISEANKVEVGFDFTGGNDSVEQADLPVMDGVVIEPVADSENVITEGTVQVTYIEDGVEKTIDAQIQPETTRKSSFLSLFTGGQPTVTRRSDGTLEVDFGKQVAVKKVTLTITATQSNNLAEISKVEFVNGMGDRIPEPEMDIPQGLQAEAGDKAFTLTWKPAQNVTAYEVEITGPVKNQGNKTVVMRTTAPQLVVSSMDGGKLVNNREYTVRVQSVNGEWKSGWSEPVKVRPMATQKPPAPDNVEAVGGYKSIQVSWKDMEDTDSYTVLYRVKDAGEYKVAAQNITANSYKIEGLEDATTYQVVVTGKNDLGEGPQSIPSVATTVKLLAAWMPSYKLINTPTEDGQVTAHIKSVTTNRGKNMMVDSPLDAAGTNSGLGVVDNDQGSYYNVTDWDDGVMYGNPPHDRGLRVTFDDTFAFGAMAFAEPENGAVRDVRVWYHDLESDSMKEISGLRYYAKNDENGRRHFYIDFGKKITTDQLHLCTTTGWTRSIKIGELRFYGYDSIYEDIMALYADPYHTTLHEEVDAAQLQQLQQRLDTPDEASGELHPEYSQLKRELDTAIAIYENDADLTPVQPVKPTITHQRNVNGWKNETAVLGFTGLNDWQPLGITAAAGDEITIYVGAPGKRVGDTVSLNLVATQYNAEASAFMRDLGQLRVGANTFRIPSIVSKDFERGGSLYVRYTGNNPNEQYGVRVEGGTRIPVLDLYGITDSAERAKRTQAYVQQLEEYVAGIEDMHNQLHQNSSNANVKYDFNEQECILGATELLADDMLFSVSAKQMLAGLGSGSVEEKAQKLDASMQAMDDTMELFYQHKGLFKNAQKPIDRTPAQHLNIRYHRMFAGAFMYASGNHIGIGWGSVPGMAQGVPVQADEMGRYQAGQLFGWGIGHEIGHDINQGSYAVAEVTNNYFAQLATYQNGPTRFGYESVYDKVTSGTVGSASNVFTQLAMYWQLRLAYDNYYPYKVFDTEQEMADNLFFARVDRYARNPGSAPQAAENGVALALNAGTDQNFMRLASAAAQRDLTDFFVRWGMVPNEDTAKYMAQFPAETRAIYYVNDDVQDWRIQNPNGQTFEGRDILQAGDVVLEQAGADGLAQNQIRLTIKPAQAQPSLLGYEINRTIISGGQPQTQTVGFVPAQADGSAVFTDTITTINNRVFTYDVVAVDNYLAYSNKLEMQPVKISHDGSQDKADWKVTTNMTSKQDTVVEPDEDDPDNGYNPGAGNGQTVISAISLAFDNSLATTYTGTAKGDAVIEMQFGKALDVTGLKFTLAQGSQLPAGTLAVQLFENGEWADVETNVDTITADGATTIYCVTQDGWLRTSSATAMRLIFKGASTVSVTEIDVLGPTGDNVELFADGMGILKTDFVYDESDPENNTIPAGSIIFTGSYKGNPAYNVVIVYDQDGKIVGYKENGEGTANQIILADVPDQGDLGNTSDGRWVYWIEPDAVLPEKVRVELYRVDDAQTNNGQRLVSDSAWAAVPEKLPDIEITTDAGQTN